VIDKTPDKQTLLAHLRAKGGDINAASIAIAQLYNQPARDIRKMLRDVIKEN